MHKEIIMKSIINTLLSRFRAGKPFPDNGTLDRSCRRQKGPLNKPGFNVITTCPPLQPPAAHAESERLKEADMDNAYTPTPEEEEIYRKVRRQYVIEDVLTEADSADCRITLKDAEAIADIIIANDGGDIPYWTTVETYIDLYIRDALERQMQAEGLHKYEVTMSARLSRTVYVLAHDDAEARRLAESTLADYPLGGDDYKGSETDAVELPEGADFPVSDYLSASDNE